MSGRAAAFALLLATLTAGDAHAYRLIQNSLAGRTTTGIKVPCDDPVGFAHWTQAAIPWRLNAASQGGKAGMPAALQNALAAWNNVAPSSYVLSYAGATGTGFATDGVNTVGWWTGNGCTGGCLAITALVLVGGQVITEADISLNDAVTWNTGGADYDAQSILTHELGHSLGIHHTDLTVKRDRPTMYASYIGLDGRTLEADDQAALNCSFARYPPAAANLVVGVDGGGGEPGDGPPIKLDTRMAATGANLRYTLKRDERVKLEIFDVAGRRVAMLLDAVRGEGDHEVAWDGGTSDGRARPGVYFARLLSPEGQAHSTIVLI